MAKPRVSTSLEVLYTEQAIRSMVGVQLSRDLTDQMIRSGSDLLRRRIEARRGRRENVITVIATEYSDYIQVNFVSKVPKKNDWIWDLKLVNGSGMPKV